ncbi:MAG: PKD domain-containing protein, partial [Bacteroidetes bacterium]|nr:PKD domain-containing protein [Bacteroidota bacterium]
MKTLLTCLCLAGLLLPFTYGFAQQPKPEHAKKGIYDQLDPRVDNMEYWMNMAEKGLTPYNPHITLAPAIFKGSGINAKGVRTTNSTDVPVTNLTNVTESENSVFVDPNNADYLLNSNNSTSWSGGTVGSLYGANYFQSSNAGIGWAGSPNGAGGANSGDPTTAISLTGRQYINFIDDPGGQAIAYSDNGTTWTTSIVTTNPGDLADKNHMWIDNKSTSPYVGNLYVAWTDFGGTYNYQVMLSRSVNNGVTWSSKANISGSLASFNHGVNLQTGPAGQVYAIWATYPSSGITEDGIGFNMSVDGGATFGTAKKIISNIKGIRETGVLKNMRVNSFPVMAVDISGGANNGNIYAVWTNIGVPGTNTGTNKSIYIIRSTNGGTTWSTPVRVNQGTFADGKEAYSPWISCDPVTGVLSVVFYDDRNVTSTQCEVFSAYSTNAGATWTDFKVSDVAFTPAAIPGLASSYMGDYLGITSKGGKVYPCWTDNRGGLYMTYVSPYELGLNADFSANITTVCSGSGVTFTDASTGPPTSWTWTFAGGNPGTFIGRTPPVITYSTPGLYDVTLKVSDGTGTVSVTKPNYINVKNVIADFTASPTTVVVGNSVTFTDYSLCTPGSWEWSFPGGTPSSYTGQVPPAITYSTIGTYDVTLTVTKSGGTDVKTRTGYITVTAPIFNIANGSVTTCTGDFYDTGGPSGVYQNNEVIVETFYPSTPGSMIRFAFSSFATESGYDTLTIYNGVNSAAPVIGRYHGTTSPGTVMATNGSGALTFRFRSDVSVTNTGWAATINCVDGIVSDPASFTATAFSTSQINLGWTKNISSQDVMVLWSPTSTFGTPVNGTVYSQGGTVSGGGTVLYRGSLTGFNHTSLAPSTAYYYKAFSYNGSNTYSSGLSANATTFCGISTLPFAENFAISTLPGCWTKQISGTGAVDQWTVSNTATAGGTAYEMKSSYQNINPAITRLVTPPINTTGVSQLNLSFRHMLDAYSTGCTLRIQSSTNGTTWTNEAWSVASTSSNVGPATVTTTVLNNLNSPNTLVAFTIEGNLYQYDYWYVDAVAITSTCATTYPVSVAIAASTNPVCQGSSVTFTATPTNGGSTPAYQWKVNGTNATGGTNATYAYVPVNNDAVTCVLTSNASCITGNPATSAPVTMTVNPGSPVSVSVSPSANPVCVGTPVTYTATPTNGGSIPGYQWKVNGSNVTGATNSTYTFIPANNNIIVCVLTSDGSCVAGNPASSPPVTMTVNAAPMAGISIAGSANDVCEGTTVSFTATPLNEGTAPTYQWKVNGNNVGTNAPVFSYIPVNGDIVVCQLTSNLFCSTGIAVVSNQLTMLIRPMVPVGVTIVPSSNPECEENQVIFTATPLNGGTSPGYQWKVNGNPAGFNSPEFYTYPANNDEVTCVLTSNDVCISGNPATS